MSACDDEASNSYPEMIEKVRWAALAEDAAGVWEEMIAAYEASLSSPVKTLNSSTGRG